MRMLNLLGRKYYKLLISATLVCLLVVGIITTTKHIDNLSLIKQVTSDRIYLWQLSGWGISKRPLLGWGFDGFGIASPFIVNPNKTPLIVNLGDNSFNYQSKNGQVRTQLPISNKAHNLILDTTLSVGVLGMLCYGVLFGFCLWRIILSPLRGVEAIAICYFVFAFTWFDCAQFTHLAWWTTTLPPTPPLVPEFPEQQ